MKYIFLLIALWGLLLYGCNAVKIKSDLPFKFVSAEYGTNIAGEAEIWTNIEMKLTQLHSGVTFDSVVFKNTCIPVSQTDQGDTTFLKATLIDRSNKLHVENKSTGKPDQLEYTYHSKKYGYVIKDFKRRPMRIKKSLR